MKLERINGELYLIINEESKIPFREEWIEQLRALPYDEFGTFMHDTIYPALSEEQKKIWNKSTISNKNLLEAIQALQ